MATHLSNARRILVVRLDGLGDLVLTVPMLRGLRRVAGGARISLLVARANRNLVENCPYVDEVLTYGIRRGGGRGMVLARHAAAMAVLATRLRTRRFDLAISPRSGEDGRQTSLSVRLSGAAERIGYAQPAGSTAATADRRYTRLIGQPAAEPVRHEVLRSLDVLEFLGGSWQSDALECWLTDDDIAVAERVVAEAGSGAAGGLVAMCPGAGSPRRLWPIERFAEVGQWLWREHHCRVIIVGGPGEETMGRALANRLRDAGAIDSVGRLTLRQTAAVLQRCRVYVGEDTGVMHLAAAVGLACVEISCHPQTGDPSHDNSPARFHPWGVPYRVAQPDAPVVPCGGHCDANAPHCILNVTVEQVEALAGELLSGPGE